MGEVIEKLHFTPFDLGTKIGRLNSWGHMSVTVRGEEWGGCHSVLVKLLVWPTAFLTESSALSGATKAVEDHREHCMLHSLPRFTPGFRMVSTWKEGWRWTMVDYDGRHIMDHGGWWSIVVRGP